MAIWVIAVVGRDASETDPCRICGVLQSSSHAPGFTHHPRSGRAASPIRPNVIFGRDRARDPLKRNDTSLWGAPGGVEDQVGAGIFLFAIAEQRLQVVERL